MSRFNSFFNKELDDKIKQMSSTFTNKIKGVVNVTEFGAKGDGTDATKAFEDALATKKTVIVPDGVFPISRTLLVSPFQDLIMDKRTILRFTDNTLSKCINLSMSSGIESGLIEVNENFKNTVILFDTDTHPSNYTETYPFTFNTNNVQTRYGFRLQDTIIQKNKARPKDISVIGGTAIKCVAQATGTYNVVWGAFLKDLKINGGFDYGIHLADFSDSQVSSWMHDTFITGVFMQYPKTAYYLDQVGCVHISDGAFQPQTTLDEVKYAENGVVMNNCSAITIDNYQFWDFNIAKDGFTNQVFKLNGICSNIRIYDFARVNTSDGVRVKYDNVKSLLTLHYYNPNGRYFFPEVLNYQDFKSQTSALRSEVITDTHEYSHIDYNVPMYAAPNLFSSSQATPKYAQLGYFEIPANDSNEINRLTIENHSTNGIEGYTRIKIGTGADGTPTVSQEIRLMENSALYNIPDYAYTYTISNGLTKVYLYKKYTKTSQDTHHYVRNVKITDAYKFVTQVIPDATPTSPTVISKATTNAYEYYEKPVNAPVGYSYFSKQLGKPVWCKTSSTFDSSGNVVTAAVWVDATGTTV